MPRQITLPHNVRTFTSIGTSLSKTDKYLREGTVLNVGDPIIMKFDHQNERAVPFTLNGETFFMLESELEIKRQS